MFHSSHLGDLAADAPAPSPSSTVTVPAPVHPAFPLLAVGGVALIAFFVISAIKDGSRGGANSRGE